MPKATWFEETFPYIWFDEHGNLALSIPEDAVRECTVGGQDASEAVALWIEKLHFNLNGHEDRARAYLGEFGAWDDLATCPVSTLTERVFWDACCQISEQGEWLGLHI